MIQGIVRVQSGVKYCVCYRQDPVDRQFECLPDGQEVDEDPDESSDKADDSHKQKPVRARQNGGWGAGHAHDPKHLETNSRHYNVVIHKQ